MRTKPEVFRLWVVMGACASLAAAAVAQDRAGYALDPDAEIVEGGSIGADELQEGASDCNLVTFEGLEDLQIIGTVAGTPEVTFGSAWLSIIDADAGGTGNFANEPSPDTTAFFLEPAEPIDFDTGVQSMEIFYSASALSLPVTLTAWDGPGGTGSVVDTAEGNTVGNSFDGADCTGDPSGDFCLWDSIVLESASNNIMSVTLSGATANQIGFDDMIYCTGALPAPATPTWGWISLVVLVLLVGVWQTRRMRLLTG